MEDEKTDKEVYDMAEHLKSLYDVKESEIEMNKYLNLRIEEYKVYIGTLIKINDQYAKSVAKLRLKIKDFIDNI